MPDIGVLILAAGASSRMGQPKQLLPWKNTTLLGHAVSAAMEVSNSVLVVLGANADKIKPEAKGAKSIVNPDWQEGMGGSIALGIGEIESLFNPSHILVLLVDQPLLTADYLKRMVEKSASKPSNIVATKYRDRAGVPAIFPKKYFRKLKELNSDFGAKHLLEQHYDSLVVLNAGNKIADIDTLEQYQTVLKSS